MKILIAEDDPVSCRLLGSSLERLGHEVVATLDGYEALAAFQTQGIHMVISDWMMPEMDGLELCRRIRSEQRVKYTYFILLTALSGRERYLEGMEAGADDFITKPVDRESLEARLRVAERILNLQAEVRQLEGLLPICSYCKRIRDEGDAWISLERYVHQHTDASFTHGICPECAVRMKAEIRQWAEHQNHGPEQP